MDTARSVAHLLRDTIQPFTTFSEIFAAALDALRGEIMAALAGRGRIAMNEFNPSLQGPQIPPCSLVLPREGVAQIPGGERWRR